MPQWPASALMAASMRAVWFHRQYERLTGGHVKHADYYGHVAQLPGHARRIVFSGATDDGALARARASLWPTAIDERVGRWRPDDRDILFLAGTDWRYYDQSGLDGIDIPRVNLIQHVRHAHTGTELHGYLARRAVRICVSEEVAAAIRATGRVNGPVLAIPNGTACTPAEVGCAGSVDFDRRCEKVVVVGYKRPDLAAALSRALGEGGIPHVALDAFIDRDAFLGLLERTRVAVCLPRSEEGFYLPALEAMAAGCTMVTLDCIGNRGFCQHEHNCLVAEAEPAAIARATLRAVALAPADRRRLHANAVRTVEAHSLDAERRRFHEVLLDIDRIWSDASPATTAKPAPREPRPAPSPLVDFVIVGAQKSGTSALAHFLSQHPDVAMGAREGHVFDSPDYSSDWSTAQIDARYARRIECGPGTKVCGESTPIYLFLPAVAGELRRYNPGLKIIAILRDPVERALSHYAMERARGMERLPLWLALLVERRRLRRCRDATAPGSAARRHSYRSRGVYSRQLRNLYTAFPRERVLLLKNEDLRRRHDETLEKVFAFLGVSTSVRVPPEIVFKGAGLGGKHVVVRWLLRLSYALESRRLRAFLEAYGDNRA